MKNCPEEFEDELKNFIDDVETQVNSAQSALENIKSVSDLGNVNECLGTLREISEALY